MFLMNSPMFKSMIISKSFVYGGNKQGLQDKSIEDRYFSIIASNLKSICWIRTGSQSY